MNRRGKDIFIIILAILAVISLIIFLVYVEKAQNEQNQKFRQLAQNAEEEEIVVQKANICINEIAGEGWVELYNRTDMPVDVSGYRLVCGNAEISIADGISIPEKGFLVLDISVKDDFQTEIYGIDNVLYDSVYVTSLKQGETYARREDGEAAFMYLSPSRGVTNHDAEQINKNFLYFDIPSGFYDQDIQVKIIVPENWQVYYTTDGSDPGEDSEIYENEILLSNRTGDENKYAASKDLSIRTSYVPNDKVEKCNIIRAIGIDESGNKSEEAIGCYFIANGNKAMFRNLPVLSISASPDALFGYEDGLYSAGKTYEDALAREMLTSNSANYYKDYTTDVSVQYFDSNKQLGFEGKAVLQTYKDGFLDYLQKSLELSQGEESYILSAGESDYDIKIRDMFMQRSMEKTDVSMLETNPCIVFIDGEYWGVYLLQRAVDEHALENKYGISSDNIVCTVGRDSADSDSAGSDKAASYNDFKEYVINTDFTNDALYAQLEERMDIQSYLDCYCAHIYIADSDWMIENVTAWKTISSGDDEMSDGKWRYVFQGADLSMGNSLLNSASINTYLRPAVENDAFMYSLLRNKEFRERYSATMVKFADEIFTEEKVQEILDALSEKYRKGVQASYLRFDGGMNDAVYEDSIDVIVGFFRERKEFILKYTQEFLEIDRETMNPWAIEENQPEIQENSSETEENSSEINEDFAED